MRLDRDQRRKQVAEAVEVGGLDLQPLPHHEPAQRHLPGKADVEKQEQLACALDRDIGHDRQLQDQPGNAVDHDRSEEHTSELQSLMRISYAVFCLKKKNKKTKQITQQLK